MMTTQTMSLSPSRTHKRLPASKLSTVIITGPNGVGKGTITNLLMTDSSLNLERFVRHTTRAQGPDEINSVNYHFITQREFDEMSERGEFLHTIRKPFGSYGESRQQLEDVLQRGNTPLFELAFDSAEGLVTALDAVDLPTSTIFVVPKEVFSAADIEPCIEILRSRITKRGRGESPDELEHRLQSARDWLSAPPCHVHTVINRDGEVNQAAEQIRQIIRNLSRADS